MNFRARGDNVVGIAFPITGIPMAVGDYYGQKYSNEIVKDVSGSGGYLFESTKFMLELLGLPTGSPTGAELCSVTKYIDKQLSCGHCASRKTRN